MRKKWILQTKQADFQKISQNHGISQVTARCMVNRGVKESEVASFLSGGREDLHSPWLMKDMERAIELLSQHRGAKIAIASDFDCDGICSGIILKKGLLRAGFEANIYTPDRVSEGYGLNVRIVEDALAFGAEVLMTCDNGIAAFEAVSYAREKGLCVIVTDHHEVQEKLPDAHAIVDPKQADCSYPFDGLCGAGVAFQLLGALYEKFDIPDEERWELLEFAAIATVADVMELKEENRILVKEGLKKLRFTKNIGCRALIEVQDLAEKEITSYHIGFVLGPCFNAAGRIDSVHKVFELLETESKTRAQEIARDLKEINDRRKELTEQATEQAIQIIEDGNLMENAVIMVVLPNCHESLVGIVAGRIKEKYHHPVIVFTPVEDGLLKGSARSIEAYHMFQKLMECKDLMVRFGGHKMAAGLTIQESDFAELQERLAANAGLTAEDFIPVLKIDVPLPVGRIDKSLIQELEVLAPFGTGNPKPVFAEQHFRILRGAIRGVNRNVLSLRVVNQYGHQMDAVMFQDLDEFEDLIREEWGEQELDAMYRGQPNSIDLGLAYFPSVNEYRGQESLQITIQDFCRVQR